CAESDLRAGPPYAAARDHHRAFGIAEQIELAIRSVADPRRAALAWTGREAYPTDAHGGSTGTKHIHRDGQVHGAATAGIRLHTGALQVERDLAGLRHLRLPLHHRPRHRDLIDI